MILTFLLIATTCAAQHYLPLATGNFWNYRLDNGMLEMHVVGLPVDFTGTRCNPSNT